MELVLVSAITSLIVSVVCCRISHFYTIKSISIYVNKEAALAEELAKKARDFYFLSKLEEEITWKKQHLDQEELIQPK